MQHLYIIFSYKMSNKFKGIKNEIQKKKAIIYVNNKIHKIKSHRKNYKSMHNDLQEINVKIKRMDTTIYRYGMTQNFIRNIIDELVAYDSEITNKINNIKIHAHSMIDKTKELSEELKFIENKCKEEFDGISNDITQIIHDNDKDNNINTSHKNNDCNHFHKSSVKNSMDFKSFLENNDIDLSK